MKIFFIFFFMVIFPLSQLALALPLHEGRITAAAGPLFQKAHQIKTASGAYLPPSAGLGILVEGDLTERDGAEAGIFYFQKSYQREIAPNFIAERVHKVYMPLGYRRWFTERLSGGVAFSATYSVGKEETIYNDLPPLSKEQTSAAGIVDYGIDLSVQWECWQSDPWAVLIDTRYSYDLTPKNNEDANFYGVFIALKKMVQ